MSSDGSNQSLVNSCPTCGQHVDVTDLEPYSKTQCPHCSGAMRVRTGFDHFVIVEQVGVGGMSRVFRATDTLLNRDVALKILNRECSADEERIAQFEREAQITASFSHPNVVKVFTVGRDQGYFYIAMELVSYSSFDDVISRRGRVSEGEVLNIGLVVAQGLRSAHKAGLIHRDIKPGNILFAEDGTAKIVDFGLALMFDRDADQSEEIWATPYYVAPEKLLNEPEDFRSDIYSLGATLFHALVGVPPIDVNTTSIEQLRKLKERKVETAKAAPGLRRTTAELIDRMLAYHPSERFESYVELIEAIQAAKLGKKMPSRGSSASIAKGKGKLWKIAAAAVVTLAVAAGVYFWPEGKDAGGHGGVNLAIDQTTSGGRSGANDFLKGRAQLIEGNFETAGGHFAAVANQKGTPQPTLNWALLNQGLCHLFLFDETSAGQAFQKIIENGVYSEDDKDLGTVSFFLDVAKLSQSRETIQPDQISVYTKGGETSVGLLVGGLRRWQLGDTEQAAALMERFGKLPSHGVTWIEGYQRLVEPFIADARRIQEEEVAGTPPDTEEALRDYLAKVAEIARDLQVNGPHRDKLDFHAAMAEQRLASLTDETKNAASLALEEQKDRKQVDEYLKSLKGLRDKFRFSECARQIQELEVTTGNGREYRDTWAMICTNADSFLNLLGRSSVGEERYMGPIIRNNAPEITGLIIKMNRNHLKVKSGQKAEIHVAVTECSPMFLVHLGERKLERIANVDDYYQALAWLVSFARVFEIQSAVESHVIEFLAAQSEEKNGMMSRILNSKKKAKW